MNDRPNWIECDADRQAADSVSCWTDHESTVASVSDWSEINESKRDERGRRRDEDEDGGVQRGFGREATISEFEAMGGRDGDAGDDASAFSNEEATVSEFEATVATCSQNSNALDGASAFSDEKTSGSAAETLISTVASSDYRIKNVGSDASVHEDGSAASVSMATFSTVKSSEYRARYVVDHDPEEDGPDLCDDLYDRLLRERAPSPGAGSPDPSGGMIAPVPGNGVAAERGPPEGAPEGAPEEAPEKAPEKAPKEAPEAAPKDGIARDAEEGERSPEDDEDAGSAASARSAAGTEATENTDALLQRGQDLAKVVAEEEGQNQKVWPPPSSPADGAGGLDSRTAAVLTEESVPPPPPPPEEEEREEEEEEKKEEEGNKVRNGTPQEFQPLARARTFQARSALPDDGPQTIRNAFSFSRMSSARPKQKLGPGSAEAEEESERQVEPPSSEDKEVKPPSSEDGAGGIDGRIAEESAPASKEGGEEVGDGTPKKFQALARASTFSAIKNTPSDGGHRTIRNVVSFSRMSSLKSRRKSPSELAEAAEERSRKDEARAIEDWIDENSVAASEEGGKDVVEGKPKKYQVLTRARTFSTIGRSPSDGGHRSLRSALSFSMRSRRSRRSFRKGKGTGGGGSKIEWSASVLSDVDVIHESEHEGEAEGDGESSPPARVAKEGSDGATACDGSPPRSVNTDGTGTVTAEEDDGEDAPNIEVVREDGVSRIGYHENGRFTSADLEEEEEAECEEAEARPLDAEEAEARPLDAFFDCGGLPPGWDDYDDLRIVCGEEARDLLDLARGASLGPGDERSDLLDAGDGVQAEALEFEILSIEDGKECVIVGVPNNAAPLNLGRMRSAPVLSESENKKSGGMHKKLFWKMKRRRSDKKSKS